MLDTHKGIASRKYHGARLNARVALSVGLAVDFKLVPLVDSFLPLPSLSSFL